MFYKKLQDLCNKTGIAVTSLAEKLGFSKSVATNWKKTNALPRQSTVKKIADYFGVDVDYFYNDDIQTLSQSKKQIDDIKQVNNTITAERLDALGFDLDKLNNLSDSELNVIISTVHTLADSLKKDKK